MGKKGGSSWLTAVKRAFRSPTKDPEKRNRARKDDDNDIQALQFEDDEEKKREKRRWLFRKPSSHETATPTPTQQALLPNHTNNASEAEDQKRHAIAVAAVATAQAAMEVACLANPKPSPPPISNVYYYARAREQHLAAVIIQTAFRGYLARRALGALKGLVKLQALVRGHNVRKQAKMTLRCMQALVRVQSRILDQRIRQSHSHEGSCRNSTFSDSNTMSMWDPPRYVQDFSDRRSMSRDGGSSIPDDWDERSHTIEEVKAMLQSRKEAAFRRQRNLSQQLWRGGQNPSIGCEDEFRERQQERWMMGATKPWDNVRERASTTDHQIIDNVKTVEIDTSQPYSYLAPSNLRRSNQQHQRPSSPLHRPQPNRSPATPSPSRTAPPIQLRSASPRCSRELERNSYHSSAQTPSLRPNNYYCNNNGGSGSYQQARGANVATIMPNYMAATESAKARIRSQSAPRQRPSTPERERIGMGMGIGSAKKRLSFPVNNPAEGYGMGGYLHNLRSPSFKSVVSAFGYEQQSNYSSCCGTESVGGGGGGEVSPCTSDLRRWLR